MNPDRRSPAGYEETACAAAHKAGERLLGRFRRAQSLGVRSKGPHDYVTEADHEAERIIAEHLLDAYPDHVVMAEEGSPRAAAGDHRWIVDPLDGTTNFIHGVTPFAVSIALEDAEGLVAGAIHDPFHGETFHAHRGGGARCNGRPIRCNEPEGLDLALIATGFPFRELSRLDEYLRTFEAFVRSTAGIRRAGSAAIDLAYTACGRYDGFWEMGLSRWDVAAGALIVREAGGVVSDLGGGDSFLDTGDIVAAGTRLHPFLLSVTCGSSGGRD